MGVLSFNILWHIEPLLGNDRKTNETTAAARQRPKCNNGSTVGSDIFYVIHPEALSQPTGFSSVSAVQCSAVEQARWLVSEWVRGPLRFSPSELLLLEAGGWGIGIVQEPRVRGMSTDGSCYQATTGKDTSRLRRLSTCYSELQCVWISDSTIATCKWSINPITNSNPIYSHSNT
jgi:hypothetical protein